MRNLIRLAEGVTTRKVRVAHTDWERWNKQARVASIAPARGLDEVRAALEGRGVTLELVGA